MIRDWKGGLRHPTFKLYIRAAKEGVPYSRKRPFAKGIFSVLGCLTVWFSRFVKDHDSEINMSESPGGWCSKFPISIFFSCLFFSRAELYTYDSV